MTRLAGLLMYGIADLELFVVVAAAAAAGFAPWQLVYFAKEAA
jgi:hypothetical protein